MSKADKMFFDLGLTDVINDEERHRYRMPRSDKEIYFKLKEKCIDVYGFETFYHNCTLTHMELLAINEKMKELGWFDEY